MPKPPPKNVTPGRPGRAPVPSAARPQYTPRFKGDKPAAKGPAPQRGSELVDDGEDVSRVAHQATRDPETGKPDDPSKHLTRAIEYIQKYIVHLRGRTEDKALDTAGAVRLMDEIYKFKERVSDLIKSPVEKLYDTMRFVVVPAVFETADTTSQTIDGIGRCNIMDDISVSMQGDSDPEKKANRELFYQWLIDQGLEDMLTRSVNAQTLAAFVRRQMAAKDGLPLPTNLITVKPVSRAQITRS